MQTKEARLFCVLSDTQAGLSIFSATAIQVTP